MGQGEDWIDDVMSVVADVDWHTLSHAYGSAELTPLALRTWLSGDDRSHDELDDDDELWPIVADYPSDSIAESALAWIIVSVFHQGSLYSASPPTCRVMVEVLERCPVETVRAEALNTLGFALCLGDARSDWRADGFHRLDFRHLDTYDEIVRGQRHYLAAVASDGDHLRRINVALMLAWMPDRLASTQLIMGVLSETPESQLESDALNALTASLLRTLGLVARGTSAEARAEQGIRSYLEDGGEVGFAARIALCRLRRVTIDDEWVVDWLRERLGDTDSDHTGVVFDALVTTALHGPPFGRSDDERAEAARRLGDEHVASKERKEHDALTDFDKRLAKANALSARSRVNVILAHHRIEQTSDDRINVELRPEFVGKSANSAPLDAERFLLASGRTIHVISTATLRVERTLTATTQEQLPDAVVAWIESPRRGDDHWRDADPTDLVPGGMAASPDGRWLAAWGTGQVAIWDVAAEASTPVAHLCGFTPTRVQFAWSPDSSTLVTAEAGELHFWTAGAWAEPSSVVSATGAQRLAWTGEHPYLFQRDRLYRWNVSDQKLERLQVPDGHYPVGIGPGGLVMWHDEAPMMPLDGAAMLDADRCVRYEDRDRPTVVVESPNRSRNIVVNASGAWSTAVWWWPDGRFFVRHDGNTVHFHDPDGDELASCTLVDAANGDLVWLSHDHDGNPLVSTDRYDTLVASQPRRFDRPRYFESDDGSVVLPPDLEGTATIALTLRG